MYFCETILFSTRKDFRVVMSHRGNKQITFPFMMNRLILNIIYEFYGQNVDFFDNPALENYHN